MKQNIAKEFQNRTATNSRPRDIQEDVRALRSLQVLEVLSNSNIPLTLSQVAYKLNVPKSSLMRLLHSMEKGGYILKVLGSDCFTLGVKTTDLAFNSLHNKTFLTQSRLILRNLVEKLGEACNFTIPFENEVLYLDRVNTNEVLRLHFEPGIRVPMYCTASGKLFLSELTTEARNVIFDQIEVKPYTKKTIISRNLLDREIAQILKVGFSTDNEEFVRGMAAVAVPVKNDLGVVIGAIACHAPIARLSLPELIKYIPDLKSAAKKIESLSLPEK